MGSRGRSIRLRIYFLVAIPLITMLGLFGYVAYTSVTNWLNLDRAPSLIDATSEPLTNFVNILQTERRAAVIYLSQPSSANLATFQTTAAATKAGAVHLDAALNSAASKDSSTTAEDTAIATMTAQINAMGQLRDGVAAKKLSPLDALGAYTKIIATQGTVLQAEANSLTDARPVEQGLGLISAVSTQEDMSEMDAVLAGALAGGSLTGPARVAFSQALGRQQADTMTYQELLTQPEQATYTATLNKLAPPQTVQDPLVTVQDAVAAGTPLNQLTAGSGLTADSWQGLTSTWLKASSKAGTATAVTVLAANNQPALDAKRRVWITAAVGLAGLILTLIVSILLAQSVNRRLTALRRSALALAREQLPAVVARLRRGESVDVAAEAPPLRAGNDEIGQVGEAIDAVRQTALRSAVEEAEVRRGVNDMFRNLARRNQSLLQRQLSVLDDMERRATDPDVLEDLFKMDHLTTRMRRHAEGLIILSGAPPGRSWSAPVKLVDVMRGAVAEVEDYARVTVSTQTSATLAGSAVTDVIHLLAELIENATSLSPPFTQVRVSGETVANGFAIEIEDRGLGMVPQRMQELNERLAVPPDLNPANTEQLGLFVVGQLARRHGIRVMLRPSPYGGTTAVALVPLELIVDEGPAAVTAGGGTPAATGFPGSDFPADSSSGSGFPGTGSPAAGGYAGEFGSGAPAAGAYLNGIPADGARASDTSAGGAYAGSAPAGGAYANGSPVNGAFANGAGYTGPALGGAPAAGDAYSNGSAPAGAGAGLPDGGPGGAPWPGSGSWPEPGGWPRPGDLAEPSGRSESGGQLPDAAPADAGYPGAGSGERRGLPADGNGNGNRAASLDPPLPPIRISGALRHSSGPGISGTGPGSAGHGTSRPGAGSPGAAEAGPRRGRPETEEIPVVTVLPASGPPAPAFDVFAPVRRAPDRGLPRETADGTAEPGTGAYPPGQPYPDGVIQAQAPAADPGSFDGDARPAANGGGEQAGLPRRVRQASLAPQLRVAAPVADSPGPAAVPPASAASLADMRSTLSAMQRGWQQGRAQQPQETEGSDANGS